MALVTNKNMNGLTILDDTFRYTNPFKARCFAYLAKKPEMSFTSYQLTSGDKQCRQDAFEDVKGDIRLYGIWDPQMKQIFPKTPKHMHRIEQYDKPTSEPAKEPTPVAPIESPVTPPQVGVGTALAMANGQRKRQRLDLSLKELAKEEIKKKPAITYDELQGIMKWPQLTKSIYYMLKRDLVATNEIAATQHELRGRGREPSGEVALARKQMMEMPIEEVRRLTWNDYKQKTGNHAIDAGGFLRAQRFVMNKRSAKAQAPDIATTKAVAAHARPQEELVASPKYPANTIVIWDTIPIPASIKPEQYMDLKTMWAEFIKRTIEGRGKTNPFQLMLMTDPPCLEIRKRIA